MHPIRRLKQWVSKPPKEPTGIPIVSTADTSLQPLRPTPDEIIASMNEHRDFFACIARRMEQWEVTQKSTTIQQGSHERII